MPPKTVAVVGSSGFIGTATVAALKAKGHRTVPVRAPRLRYIPGSPSDVLLHYSDDISEVSRALTDVDIVINASGIAEARSTDSNIMAANGILPGVLARACQLAQVKRYVHVSSAAVQGRKRVLDATERRHPFSEYSRSKALGEVLALKYGPPETVVLRPGGVHGRDRSTSISLARFARSSLAATMSPGSENTPQALVENVADAVCFLALSSLAPPRIVNYPSESLTTSGLLELLGGKPPKLLPRWLGLPGLWVASFSARYSSSAGALSRRLETLLVGQRQSQSWLTAHGWAPPLGHDSWRELGVALAAKRSPGLES